MTKASKIKLMNTLLLVLLLVGFACIFIGMRTIFRIIGSSNSIYRTL